MEENSRRGVKIICYDQKGKVPLGAYTDSVFVYLVLNLNDLEISIFLLI